jgi:DNA polymerase-3 subunit chi
MLIFCPNPAAAAIDDALWSHDQNSWLPHGLDAAPGAELASVWVSSDMISNPINADYLMLLYGSEPDSWAGFKRGFVVFDGKSDAQLQQARSQWQKWKAQSEAELAYFAQSASDGWEEKG